MKMDRRKTKELGRMGNKMDYLLFGMKMERKNFKKLTRMEKEV